MKINDVYKLIDERAPFELSDIYCKQTDSYDNSGVIVDKKDDINGICFALDLSSRSVLYCVENGCDLLITHHPAIFAPVKRVEGNVLECAKNNIGVISCHLNLDFCKNGVDAAFAERLGAKKPSLLEKIGGGGYGRVFEVDQTLGEFKQNAEKAFNTVTFTFGDGNKRIKKVASFCGAGLDERAIDSINADLYCSADIKHHVLSYALDKGKAVMQFTHYASEIYGIIDLYKHFSDLPIIKKQKIKICFFDDGAFRPLSEKE